MRSVQSASTAPRLYENTVDGRSRSYSGQSALRGLEKTIFLGR